MDTRLVISPLRAFLLRLTITCAADWYVTHLRHAVLSPAGSGLTACTRSKKESGLQFGAKLSKGGWVV